MSSVATIASPRPEWAGADAKAAALQLTLEKLDRAFGHRPGPVHTCQTPGQYREQRVRWAQAEARDRYEAREAGRCDGSLDPAFSSWPAYWSMFI